MKEWNDRMIYLDNAATTPLNQEVVTAIEYLYDKYFMNANSTYYKAIAINELQEKSRSLLASLLKVKPSELIFTSSGSEANNFALKGIAFKHLNKGKKHIITSMSEHSSVYETCKQLESFGFEVSYLKPDVTGHISNQSVLDAIQENTILIAIMKVNSELGAINNLEAIYDDIKQINKNIVVFMDCVQALGKVDLNLNKLDLASFSAHKCNGTKGSGLLYKKDNITLIPLICGGEQEFGLRAGTSNYYYNIVLGKTIKLFFEKKEISSINQVYQRMIDLLSQDNRIHLNSGLENNSLFIINFSIPDYKSEVILNALEAQEIFLSTKSACSSNVKRSRVIDALPIEDKYKDTAFRVSFSLDTTLEEVDAFYQALSDSLDKTLKG